MPEIINRTGVYAALSQLLDYPRDSYRSKAAQCHDELCASYPEAALAVEQFLAHISDLNDEALEELYTRTFDVAPLCVPYLTSYIYGPESFERGDLMSKLADIYRRYGFETGGELPDHLGVLLRFSTFLEPEEMSELAKYCLSRPIGDMIVCLQGSDNPYLYVLNAIQSVVKACFPEENRNE